MIYLEPSTLTWRPLLTSYINGEFYAALHDFSKEFEIFFSWLAEATIYHIRHVSKVSYKELSYTSLLLQFFVNI
jgi:hypothetical protein